MFELSGSAHSFCLQEEKNEVLENTGNLPLKLEILLMMS